MKHVVMVHSVNIVVLITNMCTGRSLFVTNIERKVMSDWVRLTRLNVKLLGRAGSGRVGSGRVGSGRVGSGRVGPGNSYKMWARTELFFSVIDL
jgi:hypothetical protein